MRQVLGAGALGRPRGIGWRGRWEGGLGWGTHVNPWLMHVNVWQKPLQYCKVISLQLIKINGKKKKQPCCMTRRPSRLPGARLTEGRPHVGFLHAQAAQRPDPARYVGLQNPGVHSRSPSSASPTTPTSFPTRHPHFSSTSLCNNAHTNNLKTMNCVKSHSGFPTSSE